MYCEGHFGRIDGKTANGLVRHSERYEILSVVDSTTAGADAGEVLGEGHKGIPICRNLAESMSAGSRRPETFIIGVAPATGLLTAAEREVVLEAMSLGMDIVNGLHEFLNDDVEFIAAVLNYKVRIDDIRRPPDKKDLKIFSGRIDSVSCPRIAVLGTDCAIGKRTTATILTNLLNKRGIRTVLVGTGQTGLIQGARYGVALDAIPSQFCSGELERAVVAAFEAEQPDVILIEGQGSLSHPAFSTSSLILRGCHPDAVVLQHAPARKHRCDFEHMPMPNPADEIRLIEMFAQTRVIGLTINHEDMDPDEVASAIQAYERDLGVPTIDALADPTERLLEMITSAFPHLLTKLAASES